VHLKDLPGMAVFVGINGSGKSTLFHVFSFLRDCLESNVRVALEREGGLRGFREVITRGVPLTENISIGIKFRSESAGASRLVTFLLEIGLDGNKPVVVCEALSYQRDESSAPFHFSDFSQGKGRVLNNEVEFVGLGAEPEIEHHEIEPDKLALAGLGQFERFKTAKEIREMIGNWHITDFQTSAARGRKIREEGLRLSPSGGNLSSVAYRLREESPEIFDQILEKMRQRISGSGDVAVETGPDGGLYLRYSDDAFDDAFLDRNVSDGTIRMFAYLVLLHDAQPYRFLFVEEPENQLHPDLMATLAEDFQSYASHGGQVFVSTHSPDFLNAMDANSIFVFEKDQGISKIYRAGDNPLVREQMDAGFWAGTLWKEGMFAGMGNRIRSLP
jgi:predicted ATPase